MARSFQVEEIMAYEVRSRTLLLTVLEAGSMMTLNLMSLVGNILVCIALYRNTRLRRTITLYIIALAVSDLLSAIFVMPLTTGVLITGGWPFGENVCQMNSLISVFVVYISPVTMGLTALDRFVRICKSDRLYKRFFSSRKSRLWLAAGWNFVALYLVFTRLTGSQQTASSRVTRPCLNSHLNKFSRAVRLTIIAGLFFLLPLVLTIFSHRKIMQKIRQHNIEARHSLQGLSGTSLHEIRMSRSLFAVVFAFVLCWLPLWIISILTRLRIVADMPRNIELLCTFCLNLSNTVNPFIYAVMNPSFRREFRNILYCESHNSAQATANRGNRVFPMRGRVGTGDKDQYQKASVQEDFPHQDNAGKSQGRNRMKINVM